MLTLSVRQAIKIRSINALDSPLAAKPISRDTQPMNDNEADANAFGIWDGEVAVELPKEFDASLYYIGRIRTPWKQRKDCPKNARESDTVCTVELDPRWAQALKDVESCSHLVLLYWMDRSRRDIVLQMPRHYGVQRGTFALRSPARPNPIAMSVVRLVKVEGAKLKVVGLDCLDGTPLIDIKPYFASTDAVADAVVGWHKARKE
jgi:tRNA-Thr(GGU) m(6)t(6)A37 methyltransferase TsaA